MDEFLNRLDDGQEPGLVQIRGRQQMLQMDIGIFRFHF